MQIEIRDYLNALLKRWWLIAIVAVAAAATGYVYSKAQTPVYEVQSSLEAIPSRTDNGLIEAIKKDLPRHASRLSSYDFMQKVLLDHQSGYNLDDLNPGGVNLKTQPLPDQMMIQMTVDSTNAQQAADLANAIAEEFVLEKAVEAQDNPTTDKVYFRQVDLARPPGNPSSPRTNLNTAAAALLGLVLGALLALILEFLDNTLKTTEDVQRYLNLNTIGAIPSQGRRQREQGEPGT